MLFNSLTFVVFYVAVFALYWLLRARAPQNVLLLAASWIFYGAWSWKFLLLLIASTVLDYICGLLIAGATNPRRKRLVLIISVTANLLFLATFKYLGFFVTEFAELLRATGIQRQHTGPRDRVAGRHLVLHVPDDRLRRRRLSRQGAGGAKLSRLRAVRRRSFRSSSRVRSNAPGI